MTLTDVHEAALGREAQGVQPSGNTVLAWMKQRGQPGSKRTVLRFLRQLADAGETFTPAPPPDPAPVAEDRKPLHEADDDPVFHGQAAPAPPVEHVRVYRRKPDPVAEAQATLEQAHLAAEASREWMQQCAMALWFSNGVVHEGVRWCALAPEDDARVGLLETAKEATAAYREAWGAVVQAPWSSNGASEEG